MWRKGKHKDMEKIVRFFLFAVIPSEGNIRRNNLLIIFMLMLMLILCVCL